MKKIIVALMLLIVVSNVSAISFCERATNNNLYEIGADEFDLNGDGNVTLSDWIIFVNNQDNETWCEEQFSSWFPVEMEESEPQSSGRDTKDLDEVSRIRYLDTASKNNRHRFSIDRHKYYLNLDWTRVNPFAKFIGWFASDKANMKVYNAYGEVIHEDRVEDGEGSFEIDGNQVNYDIEEGNNIALKKIYLTKGE